jgi:hypothetical protein
MNVEEALKDIDQVLGEAPYGGGGSGAVAEMSARFHACICRHAPPGTTHRRHAEDYLRQTRPGYPHDDQHLHGVLCALRADIRAGRAGSYEELVHADLFADLLAQAEHLLSEGYRRAAAVLSGCTLEEHLRKMATKAGGIDLVDSKGEPRKAAALNADLYAKTGVYQKAEHAQVDAWLKKRNDAAHGASDFDVQYTDPDIRRMCEGIRDFVAKYPA